MKRLSSQIRISAPSPKLFLAVIGTMLLHTGCARTTKKQVETHSEPSKILVVVNAGGPVVLTTGTAEFQVLPSGYLQSSLMKGGQKLSLDDARQGSPEESDYLVQDGDIFHFRFKA